MMIRKSQANNTAETKKEAKGERELFTGIACPLVVPPFASKTCFCYY
jgi:hypothetical protein